MATCIESKNELENELFKSVYDKTPDYIKNLNLMDFSNEGEFTFILKKNTYNLMMKNLIRKA